VEKLDAVEGGIDPANTVPAMSIQTFLCVATIAVAAWAWLNDYVSETDFFP